MREARITNVDWSLHEAQLRDLWAQGKSCSTIAAVLGHGITRNAVIGKIHRLKIEGRPGGAKRGTARADGRITPGMAALPETKVPLLSQTQKKLAMQMLEDGDYSHRQIADEVGAMPLAIQSLSLTRRRQKSVVVDDGLQKRRREGRAGHIAPAPPHKNMLLAFADGYNGQKGRVPQSKLEPHHCHFPIDMADGSMNYCGLQKEERGSYCPAHAVRCYAGGQRP